MHGRLRIAVRTSMADNPYILARLAEALNTPVETFTRPDDLTEERHANLQETAELLEAWDRITDRQARRRCLSYVKSEAQRSKSR